jgi:hypothetical protein
LKEQYETSVHTGDGAGADCALRRPDKLGHGGELRLHHRGADQERLGSAGPAGPAGLAGAVGPQGPAGANGANGGFDPDKVSYTAGAFVSIPPGSADTSVAPCPAGSKVVGGGFYSDAWLNGGLYVTDQGPLDDGSGWYMDFYNSASASTDAFVQAYAVCAAA